MIRKSFMFLKNIGYAKEKAFWQQGISDWQGFIAASKLKGISHERKPAYDTKLREAEKHLYRLDSSYFSSILPSREHWRLYDFFKEDAVYLDIETSGIEADAYITVIGLYDGISTKTMVRGINFNEDALAKELASYKLIVTFNGRSFDAPILSKRFPGILPDVPHIDLYSCSMRAGLKGGLKEIEQSLGIRRRNSVVEGLITGDPIKLWRMYRATGDDYYLDLLVEYNEEDVVNLKKLAGLVYSRLAATLSS